MFSKRLFATGTFISMIVPGKSSEEEKEATIDANKKWWKESIVYQVYPRSFKDSDGDGIGDLKGIIEKLDYIKSLGIDVVWLNPIYSSPNDDMGYDISDYQDIMKEMGTMRDFDTMLKAMHDRGLKLVMDLVVNHSSDEHEWFKQSRSSRDNPYRNYYHWWPAEKGIPPYRRSVFDETGNAWQFDSLTNSYYLHYFSKKQPDLNWENPKLREEIFSVMRFWFDKGIDGFRMDVIPFISKDTEWPIITDLELKDKYNDNWEVYYAHGPHMHEYLRQMNREVLSRYDIMTVAEAAGSAKSDALLFVDADRKELDMMYHFDGVSFGYNTGFFKEMDPKGYSLVEFKKIYSDWDGVFAKKGWGTVYLGNHDQPRMLTRWGNDAPEFRDASTKLLTTFLLSMRATPYYYFGDELGMNNIKFDSIENYRDIETFTNYNRIKNEGGDLARFIRAQKIGARDNGRTPFQWDSSANAGFTTGTPWLKVNPNYTSINVAVQEADTSSPLNYFRRMVQLRKSNPVLVYGAYTLLDKDNPKIYAFTRELTNDKWLVLLNFSNDASGFTLTADQKKGEEMINNYGGKLNISGGNINLQPWQAVIIKLRN